MRMLAGVQTDAPAATGAHSLSAAWPPKPAGWALGAVSAVGVWLLFVAVFSDVYQNSVLAAPLLAGVFVAVAVGAARRPRLAMGWAPAIFAAAVVVSHSPFVIAASPRGLLASQVLLAVVLGAGVAGWRAADRRARLWARLLLLLAAAFSAHALLHSSVGPAATFWGIPFALAATGAAAEAVVGPAPRVLLQGYLVAGLILAPWIVTETVREGRVAVEVGGFNINFLSALVGLGLVAAVVLLADGGSRGYLGAAVVLFVTLILGNSKGVLLALLVAGAAVIWMRRDRLSAISMAVLSAGLLGAVAFAFLVPALLLSRAASDIPLVPGTRTVADAGMSSRLRVDLARESLPNVLASPLVGLGPYANKVYYTLLNTGQVQWSREPVPDATGAYAPHTVLISVPASFGLPLAVVIAGIWTFAAMAKRDVAARCLLLPLVLLSMSTALTMDWERSYMAAVGWLPLGLLLAAKDRTSGV